MSNPHKAVGPRLVGRADRALGMRFCPMAAFENAALPGIPLEGTALEVVPVKLIP